VVENQRGQTSVSFSYRVVGRRKDTRNERLPKFKPREPLPKAAKPKGTTRKAPAPPEPVKLEDLPPLPPRPPKLSRSHLPKLAASPPPPMPTLERTRQILPRVKGKKEDRIR
jgi:hypothetical protein